MKKTISAGVVHDLPDDLRSVLTDDISLLALWEGLTPLGRNEWICWIEDAKKPETRQRRVSRLTIEVEQGKRLPCCWPGCSHRDR